MGRNRRERQTPPPSGRKPTYNLAERDVEGMKEALSRFHQLFRGAFQRREQAEWSEFYMCGQLSNLERKSIEPMVLAMYGDDSSRVRAVQQFIGEGRWSDAKVLEIHHQVIAHTLGQPDGVIIVDGSGFPKQGKHSVGVAHQYCGLLGKVANCQAGVFLVYASDLGYTFVDRRLYLPKVWFANSHHQLRQACGVPANITFYTEPQLALEMIKQAVERQTLPFRWVTCDEHFGQNPGFLDGIASLNKWYMAEVPVNTRGWLIAPQLEWPTGQSTGGRPRTRPRLIARAPTPQELRSLADNLSKRAWHAYVIKEGSKGTLVAEFAFVRITVVRDQLPGPRVWAIFRRRLSNPPELKCYVCNAPATCSQLELVRLSGMRWPIESAFEEGKGELGLDHYETRSWIGWHHHMTQTFLAHLFLVDLRVKLKKSSGHDHRPSPSTRGQRRTARYVSRSHHRHRELSTAAQLCRLLRASQKSPLTWSLLGSWVKMPEVSL